MSRNEVQWTLRNSGSRRDVRHRVIERFELEEPGVEGDPTYYTYYVETLGAGQRVFLERPSWLHKGFDYLIRVEGFDFNAGKGKFRDAPTHDDIFLDLSLKRQQSPDLFVNLLNLIRRVHGCEDIPAEDYEVMAAAPGLPVGLILALCKWYFIEQDVRYWNFAGRGKLMSAIEALAR